MNFDMSMDQEAGQKSSFMSEYDDATSYGWNDDISSIRGFWTDHVMGLHVMYGNNNPGEHVGTAYGMRNENTLALQPSEYFIKVSGYYNQYIDQITFMTNYNRTVTFGNPIGGTPFELYMPDSKIKRLRFGTSEYLCYVKVTFVPSATMSVGMGPTGASIGISGMPSGPMPGGPMPGGPMPGGPMPGGPMPGGYMAPPSGNVSMSTGFGPSGTVGASISGGPFGGMNVSTGGMPGGMHVSTGGMPGGMYVSTGGMPGGMSVSAGGMSGGMSVGAGGMQHGHMGAHHGMPQHHGAPHGGVSMSMGGFGMPQAGISVSTTGPAIGMSAPQPYGMPAPQPYGMPAPQPYGMPAPQPYGMPAPQPYGMPQQPNVTMNVSGPMPGQYGYMPAPMPGPMSGPAYQQMPGPMSGPAKDPVYSPPPLPYEGRAIPTACVGVHMTTGTTFNDYIKTVKDCLNMDKTVHIEEIELYQSKDKNGFRGICTKYEVPKYKGAFTQTFEEKRGNCNMGGKSDRKHFFSDEYPTNITGRYDGSKITKLTIMYNGGKAIEMGTDEGTEFSLNVPAGKKIVALAGEFNNDYLLNIGAYYI